MLIMLNVAYQILCIIKFCPLLIFFLYYNHFDTSVLFVSMLYNFLHFFIVEIIITIKYYYPPA